MNSKLDRPLISVHFPKAGGSSFRSALITAFGEPAILCPYDCDPCDPANPLFISPIWFMQHRPLDVRPFKVVHGHFAIVRYDLLPSAYRVVLLREPVDNLISIYYYWRTLFPTQHVGHGVYEFVKRERLSLLEVAEIPCLRRLMSGSYFGGYDMKRFDVIGTHERRADFIRAVSNLIGVPLSATHQENVTPPSEERGNVLRDTKVIAQLRRLLDDDIRFYEACADGAPGGFPRLRRWFGNRHIFGVAGSAPKRRKAPYSAS